MNRLLFLGFFVVLMNMILHHGTETVEHAAHLAFYIIIIVVLLWDKLINITKK